MARRRKRRGGLGKIVVLFFCLAVVAAVVIVLVNTYVPKTATIASGDIGRQYTGDAVIARKETITDVEGLNRVRYYATEGEQLVKGSKIAEVYTAGMNQNDLSRLANIRSQIAEHLEKKLASEFNDVQLAQRDNTVMTSARELALLIQSNEKGNLINLEQQLTNALSSRQTYLRNKYEKADSTLREYYTSEASQVKKIQSYTNQYLAEKDCIVSFYTDSYEPMLATETIDTISIDYVKSILAGADPVLSVVQRGRTPVFREVTPTGWYLLIISKDTSWSPVEGQNYRVRIEGLEGVVVDCTVINSTVSGNERLVRMSVAGDVRPVLNVRTAQVVIGEQYVSGLKVPLEALYRQGDQWGVVLTDNGGTFAPAIVMEYDANFAIIQPLIAGTLSEGQRIRVF